MECIIVIGIIHWHYWYNKKNHATSPVVGTLKLKKTNWGTLQGLLLELRLNMSTFYGICHSMNTLVAGGLGGETP